MKTLKFTFFIFLLFLLIIACSSDDSMPQVRTETFTIKADSISVQVFPETEGDALELYGRMRVHFMGEKPRFF